MLKLSVLSSFWHQDKHCAMQWKASKTAIAFNNFNLMSAYSKFYYH